MPRIGRNPNTDARITPPNNVTLLVITHLPDIRDPYHHRRLGIIRRCLDSMTAGTGDIKYNLVIWDNGSCDDLRGTLRDRESDALILSRNIGKTNALKSVMRSLPSGSILAYSDDDMLFDYGWLSACLEILHTYPDVGMVTGYPTRVQGRWGTESTRKWARQQAAVSIGRFIPDEWEREYAASIGMVWSTHRQNTINDMDFMITYRGVNAYALSHHCQFVCCPGRVEPLLEWSERAMQPEQAFDEAVDRAGYLRLSTIGRYAFHMGNAPG